MFSTLRLQNYRIHRDSQYEFNPSAVTIVVGPNGSGKTSIVEALYMACSGSSYKAGFYKHTSYRLFCLNRKI
ncbi:ATP-binding cassette domain-containing protein [bacterium]|nr:ATP-binding cassette domain-containing protein [bacterium]